MARYFFKVYVDSRTSLLSSPVDQQCGLFYFVAVAFVKELTITEGYVRVTNVYENIVQKNSCI
jgi:hypothetical protein